MRLGALEPVPRTLLLDHAAGGSERVLSREWSQVLSPTEGDQGGRSTPGIGWDNMCFQKDQCGQMTTGGWLGLKGYARTLNVSLPWGRRVQEEQVRQA